LVSGEEEIALHTTLSGGRMTTPTVQLTGTVQKRLPEALIRMSHTVEPLLI
jgi:hypothetical protein